MRRFVSELNPAIRGFLLIGLVALVIVLLSLEQAVVSLHLIARIAFFIAIAVVLFFLWRDRRSQIAEWSRRGQLVFYGAAALVLVNLGAFFWPGRDTQGLDTVVFLAVLALGIFSMVRVWRDERSFGF
jgi:hypothetical protein